MVRVTASKPPAEIQFVGREMCRAGIVPMVRPCVCIHAEVLCLLLKDSSGEHTSEVTQFAL